MLSFKDKNILVTGGSGFVGSNLLNSLLKYEANLSTRKRAEKYRHRDGEAVPVSGVGWQFGIGCHGVGSGVHRTSASRSAASGSGPASANATAAAISTSSSGRNSLTSAVSMQSGSFDADLQVPDTSKFTNHTGWTPEITFEETLSDLLDYWRDKVQSGRNYIVR